MVQSSLLATLKQLLWDILSFLLSIPDLLMPYCNSVPLIAPKFFTCGYGNPNIYNTRLHKTLAGLLDGSYLEQYKLEQGKNLTLIETRRRNGVVYSQGHFESPMAALLPEESRYCQFVMVEPEKTTDKDVYILLFPSTGEMGNGTRLGMAQRLAQQYGWSSIIPTAPFYGTRQPPTQLLFLIDSVTNMLLHSEGVIEEGLLLTEWILANKGQNALVCHSGFSHGACTSAYTSVACLMMGLNGSRMASAPYSGFASPAVMADGCLESVLDWTALRNKTTLDYETNRQQLYKLFQESQIELLASQVPDKDNKLAVVRGMSFDRDGVIRPHYTRAMQDQLAPVSASNKVDVQWLPGGHTTAFLVRPFCQQRLIERTVQELIEANANANKGQPAVAATTTRPKSD